MGLERVAAVLQNVPSNYDTDLLRNLIRFTEQPAGKPLRRRRRPTISPSASSPTTAARSTFMIADGVVPGNEGRGYVLRRILRRAARHARVLGFDGAVPLAHDRAGRRGDGRRLSGDRRAPRHIEEVMRGEEERFAETLDKGLALLEQERARAAPRAAHACSPATSRSGSTTPTASRST